MDNLKSLRKHYRLNQDAMGELIGISRNQYSKIESNNTVPTPLFIRCTSLIFHVSEEWLQDKYSSQEELEQSYIDHKADLNDQDLHILRTLSKLKPSYKTSALELLDSLLKLQNNID